MTKLDKNIKIYINKFNALINQLCATIIAIIDNDQQNHFVMRSSE